MKYGWVGLLVLAACGVPEEDFDAEYPAEACAYATACFPYAFEDTAACADLGAADTGGDCYSPNLAGVCLTELAALDCPEGDAAPAWPEACGQVHLCSK